MNSNIISTVIALTVCTVVALALVIMYTLMFEYADTKWLIYILCTALVIETALIIVALKYNRFFRGSLIYIIILAGAAGALIFKIIDVNVREYIMAKAIKEVNYNVDKLWENIYKEHPELKGKKFIVNDDTITVFETE